jgi:hypothetical protein
MFSGIWPPRSNGRLRETVLLRESPGCQRTTALTLTAVLRQTAPSAQRAMRRLQREAVRIAQSVRLVAERSRFASRIPLADHRRQGHGGPPQLSLALTFRVPATASRIRLRAPKRAATTLRSRGPAGPRPAVESPSSRALGDFERRPSNGFTPRSPPRAARATVSSPGSQHRSAQRYRLKVIRTRITSRHIVSTRHFALFVVSGLTASFYGMPPRRPFLSRTRSGQSDRHRTTRRSGSTASIGVVTPFTTLTGGRARRSQRGAWSATVAVVLLESGRWQHADAEP